MKIQSVAILGAGAVGSYIIWGLSKKDNIRLGVIAEGNRARRLKESGCAINGAVYRPEVWTPQEARGVDLLVVALKYGSLPGALESIKTAVGSNTVVMSLMNGVDSEELIAAQVGAEHLLYSFIKVASHKEADGYHFDPDATLGVIYGERFAPFESERVQAVRELFTDSGVNFRVTEHIQEEMWSKFRLNVCNNLPQAILGAGVGCYRDSVHMKAISDGLRRELEAIATARSIDLRIADAVSHGCAVPATARYSTLQDLDAGRHTEIDMFSGALMRMGKELGIPTPYNEYTYHMIKAMEEKNDGLFDDQVVPLLSLGGKGVISVVSNVKPELVHNCCKAWFEGDTKTACKLQLEILPLADALFCEVNPIPVKYAMNVLGWEAGPCRLPLVEPSDAHKEKIEQALEAEGLIQE